jgi:Flp pilus assembly secretin CpaC
VWHASIAKLGRSAVVPTSQWGGGTIREAKRQLLRALMHVGQEPTVLTMRRIALHVRRSLSDIEMQSLSCEWLAIPAQDEFSEDSEMKMQL